MNGPTGYNVRYRQTPAYALVTLTVRPSVFVNAQFVAKSLIAQGASTVEIWRSGELAEKVA